MSQAHPVSFSWLYGTLYIHTERSERDTGETVRSVDIHVDCVCPLVVLVLNSQCITSIF